MSRTAEDWGRLAVSLPGWRWTPGACFGYKPDRKGVRISDCHGNHFRVRADNGVIQGTCLSGGTVVMVSPFGKVSRGSVPWPHPDDLATAGCLLALLGDRVNVYGPWGTDDEDNGWEVVLRSSADERTRGRSSTLGRACIAAAEALGRWPGGAA